MESAEKQASPNSQAIDLRVAKPLRSNKVGQKSSIQTSQADQPPQDSQKVPQPAHQNHGSYNNSVSKKRRLQHAHGDGKSHKRRQVNIFKKHKLKYQYLHKKYRLERCKQQSDSGHFGSGSIQGSSSTTSVDKRSTNDSTSSMYTSSSPSSGTSDSPLNLVSSENQGGSPSGTTTNDRKANDQSMCMMLRHAVPLVVMMQGQLQSLPGAGGSYSETTLFKCNMCSMFSNNLSDVLNHVKSTHSAVHYCFVCNQFHSSRTEFDRHHSICATAHQAFQQIVDNHYLNQQGSSRQNTSAPAAESQDQALNLSIAGNVAMRAAQIIHSKKGRQKKIKKLQKCTYCKKAFFGRFYLQRHLRSHTGEKLCHCTICGKGFYEWRNLRNHMSRFHNSSQSSESGGQSKSVSPNMTSDSDQRSCHGKTDSYSSKAGTSTTSGGTSTSAVQADKSSSGSSSQNLAYEYNEGNISTSRSNSDTNQKQYINKAPTVALSRSMEFTHPDNVINSWAAPASESELRTAASTSYAMMDSNNSKPPGSPDYASSITSESTNNLLMSDADKGSNNPDSKPVAANLGSTSSRLQLSRGEQGFEKALQPVCSENGDKVFQCHLCDRVFKSKFAIQRHLDFHADKRPYQCDQCDYKAKTKPQLKVHVMRHSGEKGFHCSICNYSCVTHSDLNRHCKSRSHVFRVSVLESKGILPQTLTSSATSSPVPPAAASTSTAATNLDDQSSRNEPNNDDSQMGDQ